jgi:cytidine deaminase
MIDYKELISAAIESLKKAHKNQPKDLTYGSAVLTKKGNIYSACNYWSYTASLTLHAEQAALAHAAAHGETEIIAIACVGTEDNKKEQFCHPCGMCKQLIYESSIDSKIDIEVIMANLKGEHISKKISELVSHPWPA